MKTISILIPTFNEEDNVLPLYDALRGQLAALEERYDYEILFIDNKSRDDTRGKLLQLCARDPRVKAIFNTRNFGQGDSPYYGLLQTSGECTVIMGADFQDPPELLPRMVEAWEQGHKLVCMVKTENHTRGLVRFLRAVYYKTIRTLSSIDFIANFGNFGLYDRSFVDLLRRLDDPAPFFSAMVAELGYDRITIPYTQAKRRAGKTSNNVFTLYEYGMRSVITYTKAGLRLATYLGLLISGASAAAAVACLVLKLVPGDTPLGAAPLAVGMFFLGGVQLFFMGLLGEYIISIQRRGMNRPLVIEERRVNFDGD